MNKMSWFRFYAEALDDLKVQRLSPSLFKTWVNLLCLAASNGGKITPIDDVAFRLRLSTHDAQQQIDELIMCGLLDIVSTGNARETRPHNWMKRQYVSDISTSRVRKHRKSKDKKTRNGDVTFHETAPEQNRAETDSESEGSEDKKTDKKSAHFSSEYDAAREVKGSGQFEYIDLKEVRDRGRAVA